MLAVSLLALKPQLTDQNFHNLLPNHLGFKHVHDPYALLIPNLLCFQQEVCSVSESNALCIQDGKECNTTNSSTRLTFSRFSFNK